MKKTIFITALALAIVVGGYLGLRYNPLAIKDTAPPQDNTLAAVPDSNVNVPEINVPEIKEPVAEKPKVVVPPIQDEIKIEEKNPEKPPKPKVEITTDAKGNQEIKPVFDKTTPAPQPKKEDPPTIVTVPPEPEVKPKPAVKPETKPTTSDKPKTGDIQIVGGKEQTYFEGFGWVDATPGGESIYVDGTGNGNIIGH